MRLDLAPRESVSRLREWLTPVVAFATALAIGGVIVAALGRSPARAFAVYLAEPLSQGWAVQEILSRPRRSS